MVSELVKEGKVRSSQDNHKNMVNKLRRLETSLSKLLNN
jgi:hypothetical protein